MAKKKTPNRFLYAPEVKAVAKRLISLHHPHLEHVRIEYVFRTEPQRNGGKAVWATASLVAGRNAFLATVDERGMEEFELTSDDDAGQKLQFFVLDVHMGTWNRLALPQREALVDHELCHMIVSEEVDGYKLDLRCHDIEEFNDIVRRHGQWEVGLQNFAKALDKSSSAVHLHVVEGDGEPEQVEAETPAKQRGRPRKEAQQVAAP